LNRKGDHVKKTLVSVMILMAGAALVFGACDDDESEEEATTGYCDDLAALGTALDAYADLSVDSTIDEVEEAQEDVADAYQAVQDSAADVADARLDDLESAYDDLASSVDDISGEDTVGEAITTIATQANAVEAARADLVSSANCS
jgi:hypothetical protein